MSNKIRHYRKKEIERAIMKKFGFFISGINLDVIK